MNPKHPDDPIREDIEYADEAIATARRRFRELATMPPPPVPSGGSIPALIEAGERVAQYYDALIIYDPLREVLIVPFHTVVEIDLERVNDAQDLLAWVVALLGKTPAEWPKTTWDKVSFTHALLRRIGKIKGWPWVDDYLRLI